MDESTSRAEELSRRWAGLSAQQILAEAVGAFPPGRLALSSAFGPTSLVLIDMIAEAGFDIPVIFVDTLHHFAETIELVERVRARYGVDIRIFRPEADRASFEARYGERLWERDLALYQEVAKVEPFRRATSEFDAWLTGRRREQASTRTELPLVEDGEKLRINPLVDWNRGQVWSYILDRKIPYNLLHDQGYTSIGDEPLTTSTKEGEDERAGRWRGSDRVECGIHLI
ncbi:MAG: phosphoadenylyl-sulfate reductase [Gemmatimonadota bacterium]|jgi:phosphoadenosine phosphosulfate reductase|nr:phosphoadenylyl-sulfate reductase [Gemmatimonadota bacterium]